MGDTGDLDRRRGSLVTAETARWVIGMGLAALVAYFSTTYGLQARMDVLEMRVKASEATAQSVQTLTQQVSVLSQQIAVLTAIVERIERQQQSAGGEPMRRPSRQFDH